MGGVVDADDVNFGALAPGATIKAVVLYLDTGNAATSPLLYYFDTVYGLPMNTNGGCITVPWNNGSAKIARLGAPFYPLGTTKMLTGAVNLMTDTIKAALLPSSYVPDAAHEFLSDLGTVIGIDQALSTKAVKARGTDAMELGMPTVVLGIAIPGLEMATGFSASSRANGSQVEAGGAQALELGELQTQGQTARARQHFSLVLGQPSIPGRWVC